MHVEEEAWPAKDSTMHADSDKTCADMCQVLCDACRSKFHAAVHHCVCRHEPYGEVDGSSDEVGGAKRGQGDLDGTGGSQEQSAQNPNSNMHEPDVSIVDQVDAMSNSILNFLMGEQDVRALTPQAAASAAQSTPQTASSRRLRARREGSRGRKTGRRLLSLSAKNDELAAAESAGPRPLASSPSFMTERKMGTDEEQRAAMRRAFAKLNSDVLLLHRQALAHRQHSRCAMLQQSLILTPHQPHPTLVLMLKVARPHCNLCEACESYV
jgi:hypothetical protein